MLTPPIAIASPDDADAPVPRWVVENIREAFAYLAPLDPTPEELERARRILETILADASR